MPLAGCPLSLDQGSKHILTTSTFRTSFTSCWKPIVDLRLSTKIRSPWDAVMDTSRSRKLGNPLVRVGRSTLPINQKLSTSEDENTDLRVLGFYKAAGVGALDHRGFGWTVRCDLNSTRSETATLDPKNLNFMSDDVQSNFRESIGCISHHPSVYCS